VAAAIAAIVGLVTLLWPDPDPEPAKRDARFDKVAIGALVSLEEFSSRQEFGDATPPSRQASLRLVASATGAGGGAVAQATDESQPEPEPEAQPETTPQTETSTSPDELPPEQEDGQELGAALGEVDEKLPEEKLPQTCSYKTIGGEAKVVCGAPQALQFLAPADVEDAGDDQAAANAQDLLKVLRATRSRRVGSGKSEPVGVTVNFDLTLEGYKGKEIDVRWSLFDAGGNSRVPRDWLVNRRALVARPEVQSDSAEGEFWIPLPQRSGPYFVRVVAFDDRQRLASEDSKPFR
ncbi:MAG: hypothetical protein ACRDN8_02380, partial [Thermoleophilaceae bacterium]